MQVLWTGNRGIYVISYLSISLFQIWRTADTKPHGIANIRELLILLAVYSHKDSEFFPTVIM